MKPNNSPSIIFIFAIFMLIAGLGFAQDTRETLDDYPLPKIPFYLNQKILWPALILFIGLSIWLRNYYWKKSLATVEETEEIDEDTQESLEMEPDESEQRDENEKGFTLVELLVVVAIIMILAAIGASNYMNATIRAKVSVCQNNMRVIENAILLYRTDNGKYPAFYRREQKDNGFNPWQVIVPMRKRLSVLTTPISYIKTVPDDPFPVVECTDRSSVLFYDTFDYADADSLASFGKDIGGKTSGSKWRLSSPGPDQIQAFGGLIAEIGVDSPSNQLGVDYDPTNGVISFGDIVRVGEIETRGVLPAIQRVPSYVEHFRNYSGE